MDSLQQEGFLTISRRLNRISEETPWVKLCGVRDVESAGALAGLKPDAIGLNLYPPSTRYVSPEVAAEICEMLPESVLRVGVFVNSTLVEILRLVSTVGLEAVQLHGDEPAELVGQLRAALPEVPVIRAWRVDAGGLGTLVEYLESHSEWPDAILVDAKVAGHYGGTGQTAPWDVLRDYRPDWPPLILAGGLHGGNVAEAIATVHPFGVDTAGGIESAPGVKDVKRARTFVNAARSVRRGSLL